MWPKPCESLKDPEVDLTIVDSFSPRPGILFPWKSIGGFFNVFPECHWGAGFPALRPVRFDPDRIIRSGNSHLSGLVPGAIPAVSTEFFELQGSPGLAGH